MKRYIGQRIGADTRVFMTLDDAPGFERELNPRLDLINYQTGGRFEWGFVGNGPAQLALALLADHLGDAVEARAIHEMFMARVIARLGESGFELTAEQVERRVRMFRKRIRRSLASCGRG